MRRGSVMNCEMRMMIDCEMRLSDGMRDCCGWSVFSKQRVAQHTTSDITQKLRRVKFACWTVETPVTRSCLLCNGTELSCSNTGLARWWDTSQWVLGQEVKRECADVFCNSSTPPSPFLISKITTRQEPQSHGPLSISSCSTLLVTSPVLLLPAQNTQLFPPCAQPDLC